MYISFLRGAKRLFIALVNWPIKCANIPLLKLKGEPVRVVVVVGNYSQISSSCRYGPLSFFSHPPQWAKNGNIVQ